MIRYGAFLSYSHADTPVARWLHRALETYRVPRKLVGTETPLGPAPRRLLPVFRDRDELPASGDLGTELRAALGAAAFLIVLCSKQAARSKWVNEEILAFKALHGDRVLALIVDGEPGDAERECFPPALRFKTGPGGVLTTEPAEPIAADIRPGGDGRRLAHLKLVAGLTGLPLDALVRRDAARRQRRLAYIAGGAVAVAVLTLGLAVYANFQRVEADRQRATAEASLDFLIGTFQIANPATENPRTISAITLIHRVSGRVKTELLAQPAVSARLLRATGDIYFNLGLFKDAERDFTVALAREPSTGVVRATTLARLARAVRRNGDIKRATRVLDLAERVYDAHDANARSTAALILEERAQLAQFNNQTVRAVALYGQTAAIYAALGTEYRIDVARTLSYQGLALITLKQYKRAEKVLASGQAIYMKLYGPDHVRTANIIQNRALNALNAGRLSDAEYLVARAVEIYARVLEPDHPDNANVALLQGRIAHARRNLPEAATAITRSITINRKLFGRKSYITGDASFYLAQVQSDQGKYGLALESLGETKVAYDATYGPDDSDQAELLTTRAQIYRASGQIASARRDCAAAIAMRLRIDAHDPELPATRSHCTALLAEPPHTSLTFINL